MYIKNLDVNEQKPRDLYLRKLALGEIQGPPTGYASVDKPWLRYFKEDGIVEEIVKKTCYQNLYDSNCLCRNMLAFEYLGRKVTYNELFSKIQETAKAFKHKGIKRGDIVTICGVTTPELIYSFFALNMMGAIPNLIDPRTNSQGLIHYLNEVNSKCLVTLDLCYPNVKNAIDETSIENVIVFSATNSVPLGMKLCVNAINLYKKMKNENINIPKNDKYIFWNDFIKQGRNEEKIKPVPYVVDYPACLVHTGGTTGVPKGVLLSNDNFNAVLHQIKHCPLDMKRADKFLNIIVPFVAFGTALAMYTPLVLGWHSVLVPKFDVNEFDKLILKHDPIALMGVPTYLEALMQSPKMENYDFSKWKAFLVGGDATKEEFEIRANEWFNKHNGTLSLSKGYSMTEASSCATCSFNNANELGSNGVPLVSTTISIFDPVTGEELKYGEQGEICINSPTMMLGYYKNEEATNEVIRRHNDGTYWIHSGDIGYLTKDGILYVKDRIKRMIIRSGYKVFPSELENVFLKNPAVETCAVVAADDPVDISVPVAHIVLKTEYQNLEENVRKELEESIEQNGLPSYFSPTEYIFRKSLPVTSVGKVDFRKLQLEQKENVNKLVKKMS